MGKWSSTLQLGQSEKDRNKRKRGQDWPKTYKTLSTVSKKLPKTGLEPWTLFYPIQTDYLLSRSRELKLRTRSDFETVYEDIKELMSAQTLFAVDDALEQLEAVTVRVIQRRDELRSLSTR